MQKEDLEMEKVSVEQYVEQVRDGSHYKGYLKIADVKFDYELEFVVPIPKFDDLEPAKGPEDVRRLFQLTVKRDETQIELTDDEYGFFFQMLVEFAVNFYHLPQTRGHNEGLLGMTMRGEGPLADFGVSTSIGITNSGTYEFPPELCEILSAPKFGCALVD